MSVSIGRKLQRLCGHLPAEARANFLNNEDGVKIERRFSKCGVNL